MGKAGEEGVEGGRWGTSLGILGVLALLLSQKVLHCGDAHLYMLHLALLLLRVPGPREGVGTREGSWPGLVEGGAGGGGRGRVRVLVHGH